MPWPSFRHSPKRVTLKCLRRVGVFVGIALLLSGCVQIRWEHASDWNQLTEVAITNATNSATFSVGAPDTPAGRITQTGSEHNDRRWYLAGESDTNSEIVVEWRGHSRWSDGGGQLGTVLRAQRQPDGTMTGYVIWHDYSYGQDQLIHVAAWFADGVHSLQFTQFGAASFDDLSVVRSVTGASRTSGVTTLAMANTDGIRVGDTLSVSLTDTSYSGVVTVTAVTPTSLQYQQVAPDDAVGSTGSVQDLDAVMPYWVRVQLVGHTISLKVWTAGTPEPSWSDSAHTRVFDDVNGVGPTGAGLDGIYAGHLFAGNFAEFGQLDILPISSSSSAAPASRPSTADQRAAQTLTGKSALPVVVRGSRAP
ncbi:MAG: hypothetical protein JWL83_688 [Actinomycetia bacterium]|nr:hypothetical protein [Actinomycetes bacterium]